MNLLDFLLYCLFGTLALFFTSTNTQTESISTKRKAVLFIFIYLMSLIGAASIGQLLTPAVISGICILLTYHQKNKLTNLICFFLGYLLQVCLDYLCTNFMYFMLHMRIYESQSENMLLFTIFYLPILYLFTKFLGWFLHDILKLETYSLSSKLTLSVSVNLAVSVAIFIFGIVYGEQIGYTPRVIAFNGILFFVYFILSNITLFISYSTIKKDTQLNFQLEHYKDLSSYTHEVERLYHGMRAFKHDYLDILSSLKGYIDEGNLSELNSYFYEKILPMNQQIVDSDSRLGLLSFIQNDALKSMISAKLMIALEKGIHIELELREPINITAVECIDLLRILGIFLNNAIDAALTSVDKELSLAFIKFEQGYTILIRNTTVPLAIPLSALCNQYTTSKAGHDGIGLYTAKKILDSNKNIKWRLEYKSPYFLVEITINEAL